MLNNERKKLDVEGHVRSRVFICLLACLFEIETYPYLSNDEKNPGGEGW